MNFFFRFSTYENNELTILEPHLFSKLWFRMLQISDEALYVSEAQSDLDRHNAVNVCTPFHDVTMEYLRIKGGLPNQCFQLC